LHHYFVKEEEYAIQPLVFLRLLTTDEFSSSMKDIMLMIKKLMNNVPEMVDEHKQLTTALNDFTKIARKNNNNYVEKFTQKLIIHAQNEEEILYPTALLVGEYLKLKFFK